MKKQDFIAALYASGWNNPNDAQCEKITRLWVELFPKGTKLYEALRLAEKYEGCLIAIAAQSSGIPESTNKADCLAALAKSVLQAT